MSYEKLLTNIEAAAATDGKTVPTNAGVLFFAKNPQRFFVQSPLRVVKFKGTKVFHPTIDRIDCQGALWEMITQAEDFIRKNIRLLSFRTEKSFMREDKFEYPIRAFKRRHDKCLVKESTVIEFEDKVLQGLNERQKKALKYIAKIGEITNRECRKLFPGISDRTVLTDLKDMVKRGILFKEGKTKSAIYRIPK